jgi:hypothetical protein
LESRIIVPFFEKTWLAWWIFAVVAILRWFETPSASDAGMDFLSSLFDQEEESHLPDPSDSVADAPRGIRVSGRR